MGENFDQMEERLKQFEGKHSNFTHSIEDELGTLTNYLHHLRKLFQNLLVLFQQTMPIFSHCL